MAGNGTEVCSMLSEPMQKYYLSTMYSFEFILGILGNSLVVFGYVFCLKTWKSGNIYLFNLTLSDFAFLCTLPSLVSSYSQGVQSHDIIWCQVNRFLLHANLYTSILFLTFISIDRYLLMKYPFRNNFLLKKKMAIVFSIGIWVVVILELAPLFYFIGNTTENCTDYGSSGKSEDQLYSLIYSLSLTLAGFLIPLCVMCFFYMKTLAFLKSRSVQLTSAVTLEKPLTLVVMAMCIFSLLFTPYHIMRNVRIASRLPGWILSDCTRDRIQVVYIVTRPLAFLNSVIDPIFYFLMGDHFREMLISKLLHTIKRPCHE